MSGNYISRMTLGTVQLGLNYGIANSEGKPDLKKAFSILDKALETGVNCLDTAAGYGDSEQVIGGYLKERKVDRKTLTIITKFKLGDIDEKDVEYNLIESVEKSLVNLGTDFIDILLMHDAKEYLRYEKQINSTLSKLIKQGCVKKVGASGYSYEEIKPIINNKLFEVFQIPVNMLDYRITGIEIIEKLKEKTIFARSIYLQGLFFMNPDKLHGNLKKIRHYVLEVEKLAKEYNISVAGLAMSYVNSLEYVDSLVVGADNPSHVQDNVDLVKAPLFNKERMKNIKTRLEGTPEWLFYPWLWDKRKG